MRFFLSVSVICASLAFSQSDAPKKARLEGSVVSITGEPVPRATIRLQGGQLLQTSATATPPQPSTVTGDDTGKFVFENIEPGRNYQLTAQRPGYVPGRYGARSASAPGAPLTLNAGAELKGLVITLTPQGVITGRVTDQTGDPVQGAQVTVMRRGYQRGVRQLVAQAGLTTNDQGEYRVANLAPGRYYLSATDSRVTQLTGASGGGRLGNIVTYYPNATDAQAAAALDVAAGAELRGIDIRFRTGRMYSIRGKVDLAGAPAGNVTLTVLPKEGSSLFSANSAARPPEYAFELRNLVPGAYVVQTRMTQTVNGTTAQRLGASIEVVVADADVNGLVVPVGGGTTVSGTVTLEGGDIKTLVPPGPQTATPVAVQVADVAIVGVPLAIALGGTGARPSARLTPVSGIAAGSIGQMDESGKFTIEGVNPGKYQFTLAPLPQGTYIKSARLGPQDVLRSGLTVGSGGGNIEIVLANKAADLTGALRDDKAESLAGFIVALWSKDFEPGVSTYTVRTAFTDQSGGFRFQSLPPGEYLVAAWEEAEAQLLQSREFLAQFASEAAKVTLSEGAQGVVEVKLVPVAKIKAAEAKLP